MASRAHQLIIGLIVRKMRSDGYEIVSFDGNESLITDISINAPLTIKRHRPDVIGVDIKNKKICIGEAKTDSDLTSKRTKEQFIDYSNLSTKSGGLCELVIGIPQSSESRLKEILLDLGLIKKSNISLIWMPDEFLPGNEDEF